MIVGKIKKLLSVSLLLVTACLFGVTTDMFSQSLVSYTPQITVSPTNPSYGQAVTATLDMQSVNLNNSTILWQVNGVTKKEGAGERSFSFQTERNGQTSLIKVTVTDQKGSVYENIYEVSPSEVNLVIEPGSFVPPFYSGRSAFVPQGSAKIVAIANILSNGIRVSDNNLIFKWRKNGVVLSDASGKGKNTFVVEGSVPIKDINIEVEVYNYNSKLVGSNSTILTPYNTKVILYEDNALYGKLFNKALTGTVNIGAQEEFLIIAYPMYFNVSSETNDEIDYRWSVSGKSTATAGAINTLLLRQTGARGSVSISLKIDGLSRIFQYGSSGFNLMFGE